MKQATRCLEDCQGLIAYLGRFVAVDHGGLLLCWQLNCWWCCCCCSWCWNSCNAVVSNDTVNNDTDVVAVCAVDFDAAGLLLEVRVLQKLLIFGC